MAFSPLCVCVSSYKDIDNIGLGPTLLHYDFTLTDYICNNLISK